ncbi:hypothetical protein CLOHAE12215_01323 [Clostridium haemolyticum]|nr:hypothetical protein CLOHAE12215_01323 [Clostridium haemolyticum]
MILYICSQKSNLIGTIKLEYNKQYTKGIDRMCNNWSYKFRIATKQEEIKVAKVILKTKEVVIIQASLLNTYIKKHHSEIFTYQFI